MISEILTQDSFSPCSFCHFYSQLSKF